MTNVTTMRKHMHMQTYYAAPNIIFHYGVFDGSPLLTPKTSGGCC